MQVFLKSAINNMLLDSIYIEEKIPNLLLLPNNENIKLVGGR